MEILHSKPPSPVLRTVARLKVTNAPLPALITREPRPVERRVAQRPGIVFTYRDDFPYAAVVHEPKAAGAGAGLQNPKNLGMPLLRHPPPPIGYEIIGNPRISSLKAV
jgi:hypothetical protein